MTDDFLQALAACKAPNSKKSVSRIRCVPRPRQEITDALLRWRDIVAYYEPSLQHIRVTELYEYAAQRLLRQSITAPAAIANDFSNYRRDYSVWWEQWRNEPLQ
jgi:hypothetical protein